jgi:site-specific recombinase XerD
MYPQIILETATVVQGWRVDFGLWLRNTPSQKNRARVNASLQAYERDVKLMAAWYEDQFSVEFEPGHMNSVNLQEYFVQFENAPATHKRKLASVRLLIKWARLVGRLDHDPSEWIPFVEAVDESPRDLLPEEEARLRAAAEALEAEGTLLGQRDSLFLHLMLDAGLRISEAIDLKLSDLEKMDKGKIHVFGKGGKHRNPHVKSTLATRIRLWLDRMPASVEGTLITAENGTAISRGEAWRRFKMIADAADVEATPHTMRHQFVMNYMAAYMSGDPLRFPAALKAASQETGDKVEVILKYYTSPRESEMRAAVEKM